MAEETITAAPVVTASPAAESAPVVSQTPVVDSTPVTESAPATTQVSETSAPVVEAKVEPVVEAAKPLLSVEDTKTDAPKTEGEAPVDTKTEPAQLPVYEFKLPDGSDVNNPSFKAFQSKLGEFQNLSKAEQAAVNKFGQEMLDMHFNDMKTMAENQNKAAWDWFNNRNKEWLESAKKDQTIGGDNFDATVSAATQAVKLYGGSKAQQIETAKLLQETGLENSPVMLRFLSNITRIAAKEGTPVTGQNTPMTPKFNPANALYGGSKQA